MPRQPEPGDLLTVQDAARLLGVSVPTMRRWDDAGKFPAKRHPINGYRLYTRDAVLRLRKKIVEGRAA
jgi:excisionase family DNA binding protein